MSKSNKQQADNASVARDYIDKVLSINRRYGMGNGLPKERYEKAVNDAARALKAPGR